MPEKMAQRPGQKIKLKGLTLEDSNHIGLGHVVLVEAFGHAYTKIEGFPPSTALTLTLKSQDDGLLGRSCKKIGLEPRC